MSQLDFRLCASYALVCVCDFARSEGTTTPANSAGLADFIVSSLLTALCFTVTSVDHSARSAAYPHNLPQIWKVDIATTDQAKMTRIPLFLEKPDRTPNPCHWTTLSQSLQDEGGEAANRFPLRTNTSQRWTTWCAWYSSLQVGRSA